MQSLNPLRIYLKVGVLVLFCFAVNLYIKYHRGQDLFASNWEIVHKTVVLLGVGIFACFYHNKSIVAWYVILGTVLLLLPLMFLIPMPQISRISPGKFSLLLSGFWIYVCCDLLFRYKSYKKYLDDMKR